MKNSKGFTLIELVVVIVILGILAAVALPKFVDLSAEAKAASASGLAGGISSAASINYAARMTTIGATTRKGVAYALAAPCTATAINTIMQQPLPTSGYTFAQSGTMDCSVLANEGKIATCTVTPTGGTAVDANVICVQ